MKEPSFYIYLQYKIQEHSRSGIIPLDEVLRLLSGFNIPKKLRKIVIQELAEMKLVKVLNVPKDMRLSVINCNIGDEYSQLSELTRRKKYLKALNA